jgi:hypothetical protein
MKFLIKLALAGLVAYGTWQLGSAYASDYRFKDSTREAALVPRVTDAQLRARVLELASENDVPLDDDDLQVRHDQSHIYVDASYVRDVNLLPWYRYPLHFGWSIDVFIVSGTGMVPRGSTAP